MDKSSPIMRRFRAQITPIIISIWLIQIAAKHINEDPLNLHRPMKAETKIFQSELEDSAYFESFYYFL
jgi:hypothetical protein